jgi:hypothetical protein
MPYFHLSTANPTGFRPWNFATQTSGQRLSGTLRGARGLGRLGINILAALPASAQQQVQNIIQYLQQAQADINATNSLIQQGTAAGIDMSDIATQNMANQNQLNTLTDEFTTGYRAMTGTVPPGLSGGLGRLRGLRGLGQVDPVSWTTVAGAVAAIGILAAAAYALIQYTSSLKANAQAKLTQQQTVQAAQQQAANLQNQAAAACSSGNAACQQLTDLANQAASNLQTVNTGSSTGSWWNDPSQAVIPGIQNWLLVAGGAVVGVMLLPKLIGR